MFGRKPPAGTDSPQTADRPAPTPQPAAPRPVAPPIPARPATATTVGEPSGDAARATPAQPVRRPPEPVRAEAPAPAKDLRKLVVGKDVTVSGELACDHLVVEGTVEASVKECQRLEIAETGLFKGTVEIKDADIGGRFEGDITVQGRLTVRSTGRIDGRVQYGELAVEAGGTLDGEIRTIGSKGASRSSSKAGIKPPATEPLPLAPLPGSSAETSAEAAG